MYNVVVVLGRTRLGLLKLKSWLLVLLSFIVLPVHIMQKTKEFTLLFTESQRDRSLHGRTCVIYTFSFTCCSERSVLPSNYVSAQIIIELLSTIQ